jgi:hypothetical protein
LAIRAGNAGRVAHQTTRSDVSRDNLDENGGGNQGLKRRPVAKS